MYANVRSHYEITDHRLTTNPHAELHSQPCSVLGCRFFPDGVVAYRTSPHTVAQVAKTLVRKTRRLQSSALPSDHDVLYGQYNLQVPCCP